MEKAQYNWPAEAVPPWQRRADKAEPADESKVGNRVSADVLPALSERTIASVRSVSISDQAQDRILDALLKTRALADPQYGLFQFARHLKPIAAAYCIDESSPSALEDAVRGWHIETRPADEPFTVTWARFVKLWPRIKTPAGSGFFDAVVERVEHMGGYGDHYDEPATNKLLCLCWDLARTSTSDRIFYLSCRTAAKICGFRSHDEANDRLRMLVSDRWLEVIAPGKGWKATRYRFLRRLNWP